MLFYACFSSNIAGTIGIASTFSWIEPLKAYLIGLTILVLGFAWYQKLIPITIGTRKEIDCECETDEKPKFIQSKTFLGIATAFAIIMLAFPYYSVIFCPNTKKQTNGNPIKIRSYLSRLRI